ncbi:hypothetical protein HK104_002835 [Borealophlyctis nickersoniae]|nr:hypothetical protein HK104_002835 [Borealophlyctis nickersoniae]
MNDILLLTADRYLTLTCASRLKCTSKLFDTTITESSLLKVLKKDPSKWHSYRGDPSVKHYYMTILDYFLPQFKSTLITLTSKPVTINTFTRLTRLVLETDLPPQLIIQLALDRAINVGWVDAVCLLADHQNVDLLPAEEIWVRQTHHRMVSYAVRNGFADVAGALLDRGFPAGDALDMCIRAPQEKVEEVVRVLVGKELSIFSEAGKCEVMGRAVSAGREDLVRLWLRYGADACEENDLPLSMAVSKGSTVIVDVLLAAGADIESRHGGAIRTAVKNRDKTMLQHLMQKGAKVRVGNDMALRTAVLNCDIDCAQLLIQAGCDVHSHADAWLISVVEKSEPTMTGFLLDHGANVHTNNDLALKTAVVNRSTEMITLLSTYGATVETVPDAILISAVQTNDITKAREAIHRGADVLTMNSYPLKFAVKGRHPEMVRLLLEHGGKVAPLEGPLVAVWWHRGSPLYHEEISRMVLEYRERE